MKQAIMLGATIRPLHLPNDKVIYFEGGDFLKAPDRSLFF